MCDPAVLRDRRVGNEAIQIRALGLFISTLGQHFLYFFSSTSSDPYITFIFRYRAVHSSIATLEALYVLRVYVCVVLTAIRRNEVTPARIDGMCKRKTSLLFWNAEIYDFHHQEFVESL